MRRCRSYLKHKTIDPEHSSTVVARKLVIVLIVQQLLLFSRFGIIVLLLVQLLSTRVASQPRETLCELLHRQNKVLSFNYNRKKAGCMQIVMTKSG